MRNILKKTNNKGFLVVEVILAASVLALTATALIGAYVYGKQVTAAAGNRITAVSLVEEGQEAVRNIRYDDPQGMETGTFGIGTANGEWAFTEEPDETGIFTRTVVIEQASSNRFNATVTVEWEDHLGRTRDASAVTRLTTWIQDEP